MVKYIALKMGGNASKTDLEVVNETLTEITATFIQSQFMDASATVSQEGSLNIVNTGGTVENVTVQQVATINLKALAEQGMSAQQQTELIGKLTSALLAAKEETPSVMSKDETASSIKNKVGTIVGNTFKQENIMKLQTQVNQKFDAAISNIPTSAQVPAVTRGIKAQQQADVVLSFIEKMSSDITNALQSKNESGASNEYRQTSMLSNITGKLVDGINELGNTVAGVISQGLTMTTILIALFIIAALIIGVMYGDKIISAVTLF